MPRKKSGDDLTRVTIHLERASLEAIRRIATQQGLDVAKVIRKMVAAALAALAGTHKGSS